MIDTEKTNMLRKKIQKEKDSFITDNSNTLNYDERFAFLLVFVSRFFAFYGTQWLLMTKLNCIPFTIAESIIIYLGVITISTNFIKKNS
jgi:hypothetical protein